jgi:CRP-like cAMP-binding protein
MTVQKDFYFGEIDVLFSPAGKYESSARGETHGELLSLSKQNFEDALCFSEDVGTIITEEAWVRS